MYYFVIATLMGLFPVLSITLEAAHRGVPVNGLLICKWFVFWAVGLRLLLAGFRQVVQPLYTARQILGLRTDESLFLVRELGFANIAIGTTATVSLFVPAWRFAAALVGGIFYGLAGCSHVFRTHRNRLENVAMVSDLFAAVVLLAVLFAYVGPLTPLR
jgi:hypothetical protein